MRKWKSLKNCSPSGNRKSAGRCNRILWCGLFKWFSFNYCQFLAFNLFLFCSCFLWNFSRLVWPFKVFAREFQLSFVCFQNSQGFVSYFLEFEKSPTFVCAHFKFRRLKRKFYSLVHLCSVRANFLHLNYDFLNMSAACSDDT